MGLISLSELFNATTLYKLIFGTQPFPFWVVIQILWSVYTVQLSYHKKKRSNQHIIYDLIISFLLTFATKETAAICFDKASPLIHHPISILIFIIIFSVFEFFNLSSKLHKSGLDFSISFLQSLNQMRLFTLILRTVHIFDGFPLLIIALIFSSMDQILEFALRIAFKGNETGGSNWTTLLSQYVLFSFYWICVHIIETRVITSALVTSYFFGLICGMKMILSKSPVKKEKKNT